MGTFRVQGHYVKPYTWQLIRLDREVTIRSKEAAAKWAKQTFYKAFVSAVTEVKAQEQSK